MSDRKLRWSGLALVTTAGAGIVGLSAMMNPTVAHADDIGLVIGGSGTPIPGPDYVEAADELYLNNQDMTTGTIPDAPLYPDLTFYQATSTDPTDPGFYGNGLFTPEGAYPLFNFGVHQLYYNYPTDTDGFPDQSSSIGQGMSILESTIAADTAAKDTSTVFGYSQSSQISSYVMQQLESEGVSQNAVQFLLVGDPSNPNGGLFERFAGFETTTGTTVSDPLSIPSLGAVFDSATPDDDYLTNIYSLEYDGFADFPRYPINFLADANAFLGIATIHGTYLNGGVDGSGPTAEQIANAILLPGSMDAGNVDSLTNYFMIDQTAPLVALLPTQLQELLGPDLTYLINLGYGDGSLGYSDTAANVATPFGLFPDVSLSTVFSTLVTDTEQGIQDLTSGTDPYSAAVDSTASSATTLPDLLSALEADAADPSATFTDLVNAISTSASALYSILLPTADIINALVTSLPTYDLSLFTDNLSTGDLTDAFGLPIAATTGISTLAAGFEVDVIEGAFSQIQAAFSGLF
jgi:hypothetical protein